MNELRWEWPAARTPDASVVVEVTAISTPSKGLLKIETGPSLARTLPNPRELRAEIRAPVDRTGTVRLMLPATELPAYFKLGESVRLLLLHGEVCIGVERAAAGG